MSSEGDVCRMNTMKNYPCSKFSGTAACVCHIEEKVRYSFQPNLMPQKKK